MSSISFCINTARNEINHIKLLFKSLQENLSTTLHEIIVFVDSDNQGTTEWLIEQKSIFPNLKILKNELPICYGYARNINIMFEQASNEIVSYLQSDMVICKNYDLEILKHLEPHMILCSTRIEPPLHGNSGEKITYDFGLDPEKFNLLSFTKYAEQQKQEKITEYFFAPFTLYKDTWNSIGGHDTLFRRSREDSDILTRLVLNGSKIIQVWNAIVYHFTCTSSRGKDWFDPNNQEAQNRVKLQQVADNIELTKFYKKWGNFSHSISKINYYSISANILGKNPILSKFIAFESFFDKVYVEDETIINLVQKEYDKQQTVANQLLNISFDVWEKYGYMYNQLKASDRIKPLSESKGDIIIEFDINEIDENNTQQFLFYLQQIINETEELGEFEYGPFKIVINEKIDKATNRIFVSNPSIKQEHLYKII
jgi:glycosyltransferase involved in cell wall biosynthesis